jgi:AcrR family transcriptional regulator
MPRPSQAKQKKKKLLPVIAKAFSELGYRRATTAELAERCGVRENILYRLWPSKKEMFLAAIEYVFELSAVTWQKIIDQEDPGSTSAERILDHEATHHGEFGLYRIVFAGLSESDDPEIRAALKRMYGRYHRFIEKQITAHEEAPPPASRDRKDGKPDRDLLAWAVVGLGTVANISREMRLLSDAQRRTLVASVGRLLLKESML